MIYGPSTWRIVRAFILVLALLSCSRPPVSTPRTENRVEWAGHKFREVTTLGALPPSVQGVLGVGKPGLDGIAEPGGKYNTTDIVDSRYPRRRFLVAGVDDGAALVAVERGGIGWNVQVTLYENVAHEPFVSETWTLFESPHGLRALCDGVRRGKGERYQLRIEQKKQP